MSADAKRPRKKKKGLNLCALKGMGFQLLKIVGYYVLGCLFLSSAVYCFPRETKIVFAGLIVLGFIGFFAAGIFATAWAVRDWYREESKKCCKKEAP